MFRQLQELSAPEGVALSLSMDGSDLRSRLIPYECTDFTYDSSVKRPALTIIGDRQISINGISLALDAPKTFILNELRLTQGYGVDTQEMLDLGFVGDASYATQVLHGLASTINELGGRQYIDEVVGDRGHVEAVLLPEVEVIDLREQLPAPQHTQKALGEGVVRDQSGRIALRETGGIDFVAPKHRAAITLAMLRDFGPWAHIDTTLTQNLIAPTARRLQQPILPIVFPARLTREEEDVLLAEKEQAILQYMELEAFPSAGELDVIVDGISAYYELFAHNLELVHTLARRSESKVSYADAYQEGAKQVLNAALHIGLNYDRPVNFWTIAYNNIRRGERGGLAPLYYDSVLPPGTFPYSQVPRLREFYKKLQVIREEEGSLPNVAELGKRFKMGRDTVLGFMAVGYDRVYIDDTQSEHVLEEEASSLVAPDFVDALLTGLNDEAMIKAVFEEAPLSENQKIILSIYYGIFCKALAGRPVMRQSQTVFVYPKNLEAFLDLVDEHYDLSAMGVRVFKAHAEFARKLHDSALADVQRYMAQQPKLDLISRKDQKAEERQDFINAALLVSPTKRLGNREITAHFGDGELPGGVDRIRKIFGSVPEFQKACGFEPDRGQGNATLTDQEIINMALQLQPDGPLRARQIRALSKKQEFVGLQAILGRWKSLSAFHKDCGFEV